MDGENENGPSLTCYLSQYQAHDEGAVLGHPRKARGTGPVLRRHDPEQPVSDKTCSETSETFLALEGGRAHLNILGAIDPQR